MTDDPAEFGRQLAEHNPAKPTNWANIGVPLTLIGEVLKMLIEKDLLNQGTVINRLEGVMQQFMSDEPAAANYAVGLIQIVRDIVAGELDRKPS